MKLSLLEILICPKCKGFPLSIRGNQKTGEIKEGELICKRCGAVYPVVDGIPHFISEEEVKKGEAH